MMNIFGQHYLARHLAGEIYQIKVVCNDRGFVFGPVEKQHAQISAEGIVYRPDGKGSALAGMVYSEKFEMRASEHFKLPRVKIIFLGFAEQLLKSPTEIPPELMQKLIEAFHVKYDGETWRLEQKTRN
jgi:hypothetical protein